MSADLDKIVAHADRLARQMGGRFVVVPEWRAALERRVALAREKAEGRHV